MLKIINNFLNVTTMYKVLLYGLFTLSVYGIIVSALGILDFDFVWMILSLITFIFSCYFINEFVAKLLNISTNSESAVITALILFLIIQPASSLIDLLAIFLISTIAMASKYIFVANRIHIFNPAAVGAFAGGLALNYYATWWAGSAAMLPVVAIIGALIVKKVRRLEMVVTFIISSIISAFISNFGENISYSELLIQLFTAWPIIFFATVMLTEPLTMPGTKKLQIIYALVVGILFGTRFNIGPIYSSPELALIIGNILFFILYPRYKFVLTLKDKYALSSDIYEYIFAPDKKVNFTPGQYIEWTLSHNNPDSRGNRRFFTIASSTTESDIKIGIRMNNPGSSFKNSLKELKQGDKITVAHVAGDFTFDESKPAVFIAGGIGITPFRSIVKYLLDKNKKHDVTLFYFAKSAADFVYKDIFDTAEKVGLKTHYIVSDASTNLEELIKANIESFNNKKYYLSGPNAMVDSYKNVLHEMGINRSQIITDYFPGF